MIPSIFELHDVFFDEEACKRYILEKDVFYHNLICPGCSSIMERSTIRWTFRCPTKRCRKEFSLTKHTFFFGSKLSINKILYLGHLWLNRVSGTSAQSITSFSRHTITNFYHHFRELVSSTLDEEDQIIGGEGIIVEVDETKLGKRKYQRGHRVDGVWIVVGIERTEARRVFLIPVNDRKAETLTDIVTKHVHPGSIIHTDCWKGYSQLADVSGFEHRVVNHSIGFKDHNTGIHTNYVEGTNYSIKRQIPVRCRVKEGIEMHLLEFIWRRRNENNLWDSFISAIRDIHYDLQ